MKIELKNIKHSEFASRETNCYEATIYINGKREGLVSNDGHGGCDHVTPWQLAKEIDEYAKTLPPIVCEWNDPTTGKPMLLEQTHETIFGDLLTNWLIDKDLKRLMKTKILFTRDGQLYETSKASRISPSESIQILNNLPFDQARKIYKENANV